METEINDHGQPRLVQTQYPGVGHYYMICFVKNTNTLCVYSSLADIHECWGNLPKWMTLA